MQTFSDFGSGRPWGLKQGGEITRAAQVSEKFRFGKKRVHIPVHHLPSNISFFAAQCGHLRRIHSREGAEHLKLQVFSNSQFQPQKTLLMQCLIPIQNFDPKNSPHASIFFQTSCRDGPAKTACAPDIRKSSRLKNQQGAGSPEPRPS